MRGTPEAYEKLTIKNSDTLYFISKPNSLDGALYLGSKLIAGGPDAATSVGLNDLSDVIIDTIADGQLLVYDLTKSAWVNATVDEVIQAFVGATANSAGVAGLVPAPALGQTDAFLKSDGTWAKISTSQNITSIVNDSGKSHEDIMNEVAKVETPVTDDILIVKDLIADDKYAHTAYVYSGTKWEAMDGNYDAENVYFKDDFIFTEPVGTVTIPASGNVVVPAAGKNVKEFLTTLFAQEENPDIIPPSADIYLTSTTTSYEVGSTFSPGYTIRFYGGSYEFGPTTGVEMTNHAIQDTLGNKSTQSSATFNSVTVDDGFNYQAYGTITYSNGNIPLTNLGNEYSEGQILTDTIEAISKTVVVGHRNTFFGTFTTKEETVSSDDIRSLKASNKALTNGSTFSINIPIGAMRVVIAYPADLRELTSVKDVNALGADIVSSFKEISVQVKGYNNYKSKEYRVYILDYAFGAVASNVYNVTI